MKVKITTAFLFGTLIGCTNQKIDTKTEGDKLMQVSREWSKSASADSIEKTLGYWADDAVVMSPGQAPLKGKKAIREMIESSFKIPGFKISWEPLSVSVSESGDMAYMIEQNQITVNDSSGHAMTEFNKAVTIWRKQTDGSWKNIVDMWNADTSQRKIRKTAGS
ncbi:MAG TPA: nuclear transport factor 2 family protein [Chitinophagaceae bacterium]|nr:nuclear transport factor 2 family protein [Chitinophagaceae bacterium]